MRINPDNSDPIDKEQEVKQGDIAGRVVGSEVLKGAPQTVYCSSDDLLDYAKLANYFVSQEVPDLTDGKYIVFYRNDAEAAYARADAAGFYFCYQKVPHYQKKKIGLMHIDKRLKLHVSLPEPMDANDTQNREIGWRCVAELLMKHEANHFKIVAAPYKMSEVGEPGRDITIYIFEDASGLASSLERVIELAVKIETVLDRAHLPLGPRPNFEQESRRTDGERAIPKLRRVSYRYEVRGVKAELDPMQQPISDARYLEIQSNMLTEENPRPSMSIEPTEANPDLERHVSPPPVSEGEAADENDNKRTCCFCFGRR